MCPFRYRGLHPEHLYVLPREQRHHPAAELAVGWMMRCMNTLCIMPLGLLRRTDEVLRGNELLDFDSWEIYKEGKGNMILYMLHKFICVCVYLLICGVRACVCVRACLRVCICMCVIIEQTLLKLPIQNRKCVCILRSRHAVSPKTVSVFLVTSLWPLLPPWALLFTLGGGDGRGELQAATLVASRFQRPTLLDFKWSLARSSFKLSVHWPDLDDVCRWNRTKLLSVVCVCGCFWYRTGCFEVVHICYGACL